MTIPPTGHYARHSPDRLPVLIRLVQTTDLPDGINALASADGGTIIVRAGLDKITRRRAIREVLAHRFPGVLVFPVLAGLHLRRAVIGAAHAAARLVQSAAALISPSNPAVLLVASAAVVTATAAGAVMTLTGRTPHNARTPALASAAHRRDGTRPASTSRHPAALARRASRPAGGRPFRASGPVPKGQPGTVPVPVPSVSVPVPVPSVSVPVPVPSVSVPVPLPSVSVPVPLPSVPVPLPSVPVPSVPVSALLPPIPVPSLLPVPPLPSPSPTCLQLGPPGACLTP